MSNRPNHRREHRRDQRTEPWLDPPNGDELDLTDWCTQHGPDQLQPFTGPHGECLLCVGREAHQDHVRVEESVDEPRAFEDWLCGEYGGQEYSGIQLLEEHWPLVLRRFRWDTGLEGDRVTVHVSVCAWCQQFQAVRLLREGDSLRDDHYILSHDMCDSCLAKQAAEADADLSVGWAGQRAEEQRYELEYLCCHGQLRGEPCPPCEDDARGDWEYDRRGDR